jgi:hypothetical protein
MTRIILAAAFLAFLPACGGKHFQPWSGRDVGLQIADVSLQVVDWGQTRDLTARYDEGRWEMNPVLGHYPTRGEVDLYFVSTIIAKVFVTWWLDPEYRPWWQVGMMMASGTCVVNNANKGLVIDF